MGIVTLMSAKKGDGEGGVRVAPAMGVYPHAPLPMGQDSRGGASCEGVVEQRSDAGEGAGLQQGEGLLVPPQKGWRKASQPQGLSSGRENRLGRVGQSPGGRSRHWQEEG